MKEETIDHAIEFAKYLAETLAPDYREGGWDDTAGDVEEAARIIRALLPAAHACQGLEIPADAPAGVLAEAVSLVSELLCDQETMRDDLRNEALCEKARAILAKLTP